MYINKNTEIITKPMVASGCIKLSSASLDLTQPSLTAVETYTHRHTLLQAHTVVLRDLGWIYFICDITGKFFTDVKAATYCCVYKLCCSSGLVVAITTHQKELFSPYFYNNASSASWNEHLLETLVALVYRWKFIKSTGCMGWINMVWCLAKFAQFSRKRTW